MLLLSMRMMGLLNIMPGVSLVVVPLVLSLKHTLAIYQNIWFFSSCLMVLLAMRRGLMEVTFLWWGLLVLLNYWLLRVELRVGRVSFKPILSTILPMIWPFLFMFIMSVRLTQFFNQQQDFSLILVLQELTLATEIILKRRIRCFVLFYGFKHIFKDIRLLKGYFLSGFVALFH
jgi:hypothetical protein